MNSNASVFETQLGWVGISGSDIGIKQLILPVGSFSEACRLIGIQDNYEENPSGVLADIIDRVKIYLKGHKVDFTDKVDYSGATEFQRMVWKTNRLIPYGETRSYSWIAEQIGRPNAARAVGQAVGSNQLPLIIPCHRVLAKDGSIGGYGGGINLKRYLLKLETI